MLTLYLHPFSSYSQKALIAFDENAIPFTCRSLEEPGAGEELRRLWPIAKFPLLTDGDKTIFDATAIIEHLAVHIPGPVALIPADLAKAAQVRMLDRFFDNYVMTPVQQIVAAWMEAGGRPAAERLAAHERMLATAYDWLEAHLPADGWIAGDFGLADCAAAPSLFYADWLVRIDAAHPRLAAYRARLNARPSVARAIEGGRPFRHYFPPGAPDRD